MLLWVVFNTVRRKSRQTLCKVKLDVRVSWQRTSWKWLFMNVYSGKVQRWEVLPRLIQFTIHSLWVSTDYHTKYIQREKGGGAYIVRMSFTDVIYLLFIYFTVSKAHAEADCDFLPPIRSKRLAQPSNTQLPIPSTFFPSNYSLTLLTRGRKKVR